MSSRLKWCRCRLTGGWHEQDRLVAATAGEREQMTRVEVDPGTCGLKTIIRARGDEEGRVHLEVESDCQVARKLAALLKPIDPYTEGGTVFGTSVYQAADTCLKHTECIVPAAMIRAVNVEVGLALPHEAWLRIEKE